LWLLVAACAGENPLVFTVSVSPLGVYFCALGRLSELGNIVPFVAFVSLLVGEPA
jgi:hypothetical protein